MFGRKKAKRAVAAVRTRKITNPAKAKKPVELSSAEKTMALSNSRHERTKSTPAI
jgi:hypothetical protein